MAKKGVVTGFTTQEHELLERLIFDPGGPRYPGDSMLCVRLEKLGFLRKRRGTVCSWRPLIGEILDAVRFTEEVVVPEVDASGGTSRM